MYKYVIYRLPIIPAKLADAWSHMTSELKIFPGKDSVFYNQPKK
jgi:hypothetical protein